jgi:PTH1 family peptidyl-tRNA hydrolase
MKLIIGLGNPGRDYAQTRHNVGFEVIDLLARRHAITLGKRDFKAVLGEGTIAGERVILARPMTFMNLSGDSVAAIARFYKLEPSDVMVILDDVALPLGRLRLRYKGSAGGHNGLENIIARLHTPEFARIRVGVGAASSGNLVGHVLSRFRKEEIPVIEEAYQRAADAVEVALREGFDMAMNRFNVGEKPEPKPKPEPKDDAPPSI